MIRLAFLCLIFFISAASIEPAPLIRLNDPNPLELSEENRHQLTSEERISSTMQTFERHTFPWKTLLLSIFLITLVPLVVAFLKSSKKPVALPESIKQQALQKLSQIKKEANSTVLDQVSFLLRSYIQDRFGIRAPHLTTEEFLIKATEHPFLSPKTQQQLVLFLRTADLTKFGRITPKQEQVSNFFKSIEAFIEST